MSANTVILKGTSYKTWRFLHNLKMDHCLSVTDYRNYLMTYIGKMGF